MNDTESQIYWMESIIPIMLRRVKSLEDLVGANDQDLGRLAYYSPAGTPPPPPPPPPTDLVRCGGCCTGLGMPTSIPFTDSVYGAGTLVWDGVSTWTVCLSGLVLGGSGVPCGNPTFAIKYVLNTSCQLSTSWVVNNTSHCPVASTCALTAGFGQSLTSVTFSTTGTSCGTNPATVTFTNPNSTTASQLLHAGHVAQTVTLSIVPGTGTCTPFSGSVVACSGATTSGLAGSTVTATSGGVTIWTGNLSSTGTFAGAAMLTSTSSVTIACTPIGLRATAGSTTLTMVPGTTYTAITVNLGIASGYHCWTPGAPYTNCSLPIAQTLTVTPSNPCAGLSYPGDTLTWQAAPPAYAVTAGLSGAFPCWLGTAGFPLSSGWPTGTYHYCFSHGVLYLISPSVAPGGTPFQTFVGPGSQVCPDDATSTLFLFTTPCAGGPWGGTVGE